MPNNKGLTNLTKLGLGMGSMAAWAMPSANELARRRQASAAAAATRQANAARRQANARRRLNEMRQASARQSERLARQRSVNINTLINRANAALSNAAKAGPNKNARVINYHRARNAVLNRLGAPSKSEKVKDILKQINSNKNRIVNGVNWQNKKQRWWTWKQMVAYELGGGSNFSAPVPLSQFAPPKRVRGWKPMPVTMNVANTAEMARLLARAGL